MYTNPAQLASVWQRMADIATEAGETSLVTLGIDSLHLDSGFSLLALHRIARQNLGPVSPLVVAGGEGELWLLAMLLWQRRPLASHTDAALVLYAGGDSATHAAALNIAVGRTNAAVLPPGLAWSMTPTATPGSERAELELLPFALADEDFVPQIPSSTAVDWLEQLERWTGLLLALGLLIAAIVLVIV